MKKKAALIAALSSNHSWKTYKYLHNYGEMDKEAMASEVDYAFREGWKSISETDVEEVVNSDLNPHFFSMWLFHAFCGDRREECSQIFDKLKKEFAYGLEPLERA